MGKNGTILLAGMSVVAIMTIIPGCRGGDDQKESAPWWETAHKADFSGTIPTDWPLCRPFVDDNYEMVQGFLVVEKVKDHPSLNSAGVMVGDICLSWATDSPKVPETLCDAWLDFLKWGRGDEDDCWFARDNGGEIKVFSCCAAELYECEVALGTFGLALAPTAFDKVRFEKIETAAKAYRPEEGALTREDADEPTPGKLARWNGGISCARGDFRGKSFTLRDGQAVVSAPRGPHWDVAPGNSDGPFQSSGEPPPSRQWLLETFPQWSFRYRDYTMFLLVAKALDDDDDAGIEKAKDEDTLLLYWLADDAAARGETFNWSFLASRLYPLSYSADAVTIVGDTLRIDTTWRSKDNGGPVIYSLKRCDDGDILTGIWDYAASILHDCDYIHCVDIDMVTEAGPHADCWPCETQTTFRAVWNRPLPEDALDNFLKRNQAHSADSFVAIPVLEDGSGLGGAFDLPQEIGNALTGIYLERASLEMVGSPAFYDDERDALIEKWRSAATAPFLTVRAANAKAGGAGGAECVDFSFTRDGHYLVVEDGYLVMPWTAGDGVEHVRAAKGIHVFKIPGMRSDEVRSLLNKAVEVSHSSSGDGSTDANGAAIASKEAVANAIAGVIDSNAKVANSKVAEYLAEIKQYLTDKDFADGVRVGGAPTLREYKGKYNVIYIDDSRTIFSYRADLYAYTGGAHGTNPIMTGTIDLKTWRKLSVADVIPEDKREEALAKVKKGVITQIGGEERLQGKVYLTENFCIDKDGLHFIFNEYEVAAYSEGNIEVVIPAYGKYADISAK